MMNDKSGQNISGFLPVETSWVSTKPYNLRNRLYMKELLKDPMIETMERFTKESIIQNQEEYVITRIIRDHVKGVGFGEVDKLPVTFKKDIKNECYRIIEEVLYYDTHNGRGGRIYLPPEHAKTLVLFLHGNMLYGGHRSASAIYEEAKKQFYWMGMQDEIKEYLKACKCQFAKDLPDG